MNTIANGNDVKTLTQAGIKEARTIAAISVKKAADGAGDLTAADLPTEIELLQTGMWDAPYHGMFMVTQDDLNQYVTNFAANVRPSSSTQGLPIDVDHDGGAAAAWIHALEIRPNEDGGFSLWGTEIEWTPLGAELVLGGVYKFFSPEFAPYGYMDPEGVADPCDNVLIGGGLVNRPLFKSLTPVMASEQGTEGVTVSGLTASKGLSRIYINAGEKRMLVLDEIRTKAADALTDEEKAFLQDNQAELSDEEQVKFGFKQAADAATDGDGTEDNKPAGDIAASEKGKEGETVTVAASDFAAIKAKADKADEVERELAVKTATDHLNSIAFSEAEGYRIKPGDKEKATELYLSMDEGQRAKFDEVINGLPVIAADLIKKEQGAGVDKVAAAGDSPTAQASALAKEMVANGSAKTFSEALKRVFAENSELAEQYVAERNGAVNNKETE